MLDELHQLIQELRPVKTKFDLIRIGGANDGGYLIPNDLEGIGACFSPGVDVTASFEIDLCKRGIGSHLADASVDCSPAGFTPLSFTKKYLAGVNDDVNMTLRDWVHSKTTTGDLLLQMDIEGSEYATIIATPQGILNRFRIIAIEIHDTDAWFSSIAWETVQTFFAKLTKDHYVVHNHPNNNCGTINASGVILPRVFELTLIRKDRCESLGYADQFPHPLDAPNVLDKPPLHLPENWYK